MHDPTSTSISDCKLIEMPKIHDRSGNITALNNKIDLPFDIKRVYYLYDIPGGASRGGHAHRGLQQVIIAASGGFEMLIDDGREKKIITLNRPYNGVLVVPGIWRELLNFSSGTICLVLASHEYSENDYIRDYNAFLNWKSSK